MELLSEPWAQRVQEWKVRAELMSAEAMTTELQSLVDALGGRCVFDGLRFVIKPPSRWLCAHVVEFMTALELLVPQQTPMLSAARGCVPKWMQVRVDWRQPGVPLDEIHDVRLQIPPSSIRMHREHAKPILLTAWALKAAMEES